MQGHVDRPCIGSCEGSSLPGSLTTTTKANLQSHARCPSIHSEPSTKCMLTPRIAIGQHHRHTQLAPVSCKHLIFTVHMLTDLNLHAARLQVLGIIYFTSRYLEHALDVGRRQGLCRRQRLTCTGRRGVWNGMQQQGGCLPGSMRRGSGRCSSTGPTWNISAGESALPLEIVC